MTSPAATSVQEARDLGSLIRDARRRRGLAQQQLADRVGVSRQWIVEIEKGKPRAALDLVLRTLRALGLTLSIEDEDLPEAQTSVPERDPIDLDAIIERARQSEP